MALTADILDIQRLSTEDGPGMRTTVFFKGCSLACAWCHNPESISFSRQVQWIENRCIGCMLCMDACKNGGRSFTESGLSIDRARCDVCGACVRACPAGAMEEKGERWEVEPLLREVLKDRAYFGPRGGITLSGGEALMQSEFAAALLLRLKQEGIHTAVDTAGLVPWAAFERTLPHTDLYLYDLKLAREQAHQKFTGASNRVILENAGRLAAQVRANRSTALWIRTPIIPQATDSAQNIRALGAFIAGQMAGAVEKWELCAFNNLCKDKYQRLDMPWQFAEKQLIPAREMELLAQAARESAGPSVPVEWSGAVRLETQT